MRDTLADTTAIDRECEKLTEEMESVSVLIRQLISENASTAISQTEYSREYDGYNERCNKDQAQNDKLQGRKTTLAFEVDVLECFMFEIKALPGIPLDFSDCLRNSFIDRVIVHMDGTVVFVFKNGREITETID